jgi:hypothetical protein
MRVRGRTHTCARSPSAHPALSRRVAHTPRTQPETVPPTHSRLFHVVRTVRLERLAELCAQDGALLLCEFELLSQLGHL